MNRCFLQIWLTCYRANAVGKQGCGHAAADCREIQRYNEGEQGRQQQNRHEFERIRMIKEALLMERDDVDEAIDQMRGSSYSVPFA
jgi:hypothetical protein